MSQIEITCIDQTSIFTNTPEIFSGDVNVDTVKFKFDDSWDDYVTKTAVFYNNPKEVYTQILNESYVAVIPKEVMTKKCKLSIGVFGTNVNGDVKTSKILTYNIGKGAISDDLGTNPPTLDVWVQLLTRQTVFEDKMQSEFDELESEVDTLESIALGRNQALAYNGYSEMITALNNMSADELKRGQNIYIATLGVPDLWVYGVEETNVEYTYVDDDTFVEGLNVNTTVQVGYYKLAQLETQKVDVGGITNDINTLQEDVEALESNSDILSSDVETLKDTLGYTAITSKNLLENTAVNETKLGVTRTVNNDKSMTFNGTASDGNVYTDINSNIYLPKGEYILSGCPKGGSNTTYNIVMKKGDNIFLYDNGEGVKFTINDNEKINYVYFYVYNGATVNNLTVYPMIRKADVTDDTYEPFSGLDVDSRLNSILEDLKWKEIYSFEKAVSSNTSSISLSNGTSYPSVDITPYSEIMIKCKYYANSQWYYMKRDARVFVLSTDDYIGNNKSIPTPYSSSGDGSITRSSEKVFTAWNFGSSYNGATMSLKIYGRKNIL